MLAPKLLIAEDEPLLREQLREALQTLWPQACVCAEAADGHEALAALAEHRPDVAFLDIRMPHLSGLEVAQRAPDTTRIVFVTAYNRYAVDAFERGAVDYLLKPLNPARLAQTVARLQATLATPPAANVQALMREVVREMLRDAAPESANPPASEAPPPPRPLAWVKASQGATVRLISVDEVHYFQADERYTRVVMAEGEAFIKTSIKELAEQLDPQCFWQVHRATLVNVRCIASVTRNLAGGAELRLKGRAERLAVSRAHAHLFRQM